MLVKKIIFVSPVAMDNMLIIDSFKRHPREVDSAASSLKKRNTHTVWSILLRIDAASALLPDEIRQAGLH